MLELNGVLAYRSVLVSKVEEIGGSRNSDCRDRTKAVNRVIIVVN